MNQKLNGGPSESIDLECGEESSDKKKIPICERCWIFKRNKNFIERKCSRGRSSPKQNSVDRYDEHKRFLAHLIEFQQSLPQNKIEDPVVVNQLAPDSTDVKNIFVNNIIRPKNYLNLKAIKGTANIKKESNNSLNSRTLRLNRKCKVNHIPDDLDDDFLLGANTLAKQREGNKNTDLHINNGEVCKTASLNIKAKPDENSSNALDELLGDTSLEPVRTKKRKVEGNHSTDNVRKMMGHLNSNIPWSDGVKSTTRKKTTNSEGIETPMNVIEIDGESKEKETAPLNGTETNQSSKVSCPMCNKFFASKEINNHAYNCQGPQTQTRSQQSKQDSQDYVNGKYNATAWESACKGLGDRDRNATSKKQKEPVEQVDIVSEKINGGNEGRVATSIKHSKSNKFKISEDEYSNKLKCEKNNGKLHGDNELHHCENMQSRLMSSKTSGYMNLNQSSQDLIESYAKTLHKINGKNPPATQLRSFGEHHNDEHEMVKCGRCDEYVADDQLKAHTDLCLEKSMLIQ